MTFGKILLHIFGFLALLLYAAVLELSKNTIPGWIVFALSLAVFFIVRHRYINDMLWKGRTAFFACLLLALILLLNLRISAPPYKRVPAVDISGPEVTGVVEVAEGRLTGVRTADGRVEVYAGIPYAAPPVGELRFREPQPAEKWEGVRACDTFAPMAMQPSNPVIYNSLTQLLGTHNYRFSLKDNYREEMSEDCLYLNIWKPADGGEEPLPVLFFIHGGSLTTGQSYASEYRGDALARKGVIVVNFAYRLGVFGYYANESLAAESPNGTTGNYGLLDQIAALEWVRKNIASFGGDPEKITIAGESAGSSSVNAMCVSPLTDGMFRYAIAESSGIAVKKPYHTFRDMEEALQVGRDIMEKTGASSIEELRALPAEKIVSTGFPNDSMTVDGYAIAEQPYLTYEKGENHEQALLNGFNAKEADPFLLDTEKATAENYASLLEPIAGEYASELAKILPPGAVERDQKFIIDRGGEAKGSLDEAYSAAWFTYSHHVWSNYLAAQGKPVYEYYFTKTNNSMSNYHSGEMPYAYGNLGILAARYSEDDYALSETMQTYWANFVKYGDPNGSGLPEWEKRDTDSERVLELGEKIGMTDDPFAEIYAVLDKYMEDE